MSNPCVNRDSSSLMISESLEAVWVSNPCVTRDSISLMVSESLAVVWAVESLRQPLQQFVDAI